MSKTAQGLRFAPIIRVSSEERERKGESLRTQEDAIRRWVENMGGTIPEECWKYRGQEHASVGEERAKLDALLADSGKGLFDAVICGDPSRWSRDNAKSKEGLSILKKNRIRFFVGQSEMDLYRPMDTFFLGMSTEVNEFVAMEQARKSLENRIARARRGVPVSRPLPYARTFDVKTQTWGLDEEKAETMRRVIASYLSDDSTGVEKLARQLGIHATTLFLRFRETLGAEWVTEFHSPRLNIHERVVIPIPPLVPEETVKAVHEQMRAKRTYKHGYSKKNDYLLSRVVFCGLCGSGMTGSNPKGILRYRHLPDKRFTRPRPPCPLGNRSVAADDVERAVMAHLFNLFGDPSLVEGAIKSATPDLSRLHELRKQLAQLEKELGGIDRAQSALREAVMVGTFAPDDAGVKADNSTLDARRTMLTQERRILVHQIANLPDDKELRRRMKLPLKFWKRYAQSYDHFSKMTFEKQRKLVQMAFGGLDAEGRRLGVYVREEGGKWLFEVRGILPEVRSGMLPMPDSEWNDLFDLNDADFDRQDEAETQWARSGASAKVTGTPKGAEKATARARADKDATSFNGPTPAL